MTEQATIEIEDSGDCAIPAPERAARRTAVEGTPVVMGDGRPWPLATYIPCLGGVWDRLFDGNVLSGKYSPDDIRLAGAHLLRENFDLAPEAVATLIVGADLDALVVAVEVAMFGPERATRTWSDWALGSLLANGIDPATVPPSRLRAVLDILLECGRTVPSGQFVSSAIAGAKRARFIAKAAEQAERARLEAEARAPTPSGPIP